MSKSRFAILKPIVLVSIVLLLLFSILGCKDHGDRSEHFDRMLGYVAYRLDFDDDQQAILEKLSGEMQVLRQENVQQREDLNRQFIALLYSEQLEVSQLEQISVQHRENRDLYMARLTPAIQELHATLTDEQKARIEKGIKRWYR